MRSRAADTDFAMLMGFLIIGVSASGQPLRAPGLPVLEHRCADGEVPKGAGSVAPHAEEEQILLAASTSLTDETCRPLGQGELLTPSEGRIASGSRA